MIREEREKEIIGRHKALSVIEILSIPNVSPLITCALFIYFKYQMVNHHMLDVDNPFSDSQNKEEAIATKQQYLFIATFSQAALSFIIAKFLFGRIFTCTYFVLFLITVLDVIEAITYFNSNLQ